MQVEKWDREEIVKFWQRWYFPANATLYLVGDFDRSVEDCKALIERSFGSVPAVKEDSTLVPFRFNSRAPPEVTNDKSEAPPKQRHEVNILYPMSCLN